MVDLPTIKWWIFQQAMWLTATLYIPTTSPFSQPLISAQLHELLAIPAKQTWSVGVKLSYKDMPPENTVGDVRFITGSKAWFSSPYYVLG